MNTEKFIPISEGSLLEMLYDVHMYRALVAGGVDSWEWCDSSIHQYLNELGANDMEEFARMDVDAFEKEAEAFGLSVAEVEV